MHEYKVLPGLGHLMTGRWRFWRTYVAVSATVSVGIYTSNPWLAFSVGALTAAAVWWRYIRDQLTGKRSDHRWWAGGNLVQAMIAAEILPRPAAGETPGLHYDGRPQHDPSGTSVTIALPRGITFTRVRDRRERLASALGVPVARLDLTQRREDRGNVVRIWIGTTERKPRIAAVTTATHTRWADPVVIGRDDRGRDVTIRTKDTHGAFVGGTGSGKTWTARLFVAHALLDPTVRVYAIIAKDSVNDWRPMAPLCAAYVGGTGKAALTQIEQLLLAVETESEARQNMASPPAMVLVVEEWYRARKNANRLDPKLGKRLDDLMGELLATARSANIHIVMLAQRGTVEYLPGDQKANLMQRLVGCTSGEAEVRYVLDMAPQVYPAAPGEFLVSTDERDPVLVRVDRLDDAAFADLCQRAAKRQANAKPRLELAVPPASPAEPDDLLEAVLAVLPEGGASATTLHAQLPENLRRANPGALGRALGRYPQLSQVRGPYQAGGARLWVRQASTGTLAPVSDRLL